MAENPYLDLAIDVAVNRYNLDETEWGMTSFSESSKTISVGMSDGETKMKVTFDREDIRFEEMKRWNDEKKTAYVKYLVENQMDLPSKLVDSFHHIMLKLDLPIATNPDDDDDSILVVEHEAGESFTVDVSGDKPELVTEESAATVENVPEETAEEFEAKVEGKKKPKKFKRKVV